MVGKNGPPESIIPLLLPVLDKAIKSPGVYRQKNAEKDLVTERMKVTPLYQSGMKGQPQKQYSLPEPKYMSELNKPILPP